MNCDIRRSRLKRRSKLDADVLIDNCESPLRYREHLYAQMVPCVVKLSKQAQIDKGGDTTSQPLPHSGCCCDASGLRCRFHQARAMPTGSFSLWRMHSFCRALVAMRDPSYFCVQRPQLSENCSHPEGCHDSS